MAEQSKDAEQTPAEHARAVVSRLLKENLTAEGSLDLGKFHQAINKHATGESLRISAVDSQKRSGNDACIADPSEAGMLKLYYTATDEVLGLIPRDQWQSGQTVFCDVKKSIRDWWLAKPAASEVVNNHGLVCKAYNNPDKSITNVESCAIQPLPASIRDAVKGTRER